jgi:hypothetical protein
MVKLLLGVYSCQEDLYRREDLLGLMTTGDNERKGCVIDCNSQSIIRIWWPRRDLNPRCQPYST